MLRKNKIKIKNKTKIKSLKRQRKTLLKGLRKSDYENLELKKELTKANKELLSENMKLIRINNENRQCDHNKGVAGLVIEKTIEGIKYRFKPYLNFEHNCLFSSGIEVYKNDEKIIEDIGFDERLTEIFNVADSMIRGIK